MKIRITEKQFREAIKDVLTNLNNYNDGIHNIENTEEINSISQTVWDILQVSYAKLGGFKSYNNVTEMVSLVSMVTIGVKDGEIVACAIYRDDLGGHKLNGCGTCDGSEENKQLLRRIIKDDIDNMQKYHWAEISYPLESWFKQMGGNPIPSELALKLLHKSRSKIEILEDGVHYKREIGTDHIIETKCIYGFASESVYDKVMSNLEKYTGFTNYQDFKNHINQLPKLNEDMDYEENHPDSTIALAMETIIQIGNLWEDGIRELTPNMKQYLHNAILILSDYQEKNRQILALIKSGNYYYQNMETLKCYEMNTSDYILAPAI